MKMPPNEFTYAESRLAWTLLHDMRRKWTKSATRLEMSPAATAVFRKLLGPTTGGPVFKGLRASEVRGMKEDFRFI